MQTLHSVCGHPVTQISPSPPYSFLPWKLLDCLCLLRCSVDSSPSPGTLLPPKSALPGNSRRRQGSTGLHTPGGGKDSAASYRNIEKEAHLPCDGRRWAAPRRSSRLSPGLATQTHLLGLVQALTSSLGRGSFAQGSSMPSHCPGELSVPGGRAALVLATGHRPARRNCMSNGELEAPS